METERRTEKHESVLHSSTCCCSCAMKFVACIKTRPLAVEKSLNKNRWSQTHTKCFFWMPIQVGLSVSNHQLPKSHGQRWPNHMPGQTLTRCICHWPHWHSAGRAGASNSKIVATVGQIKYEAAYVHKIDYVGPLSIHIQVHHCPPSWIYIDIIYRYCVIILSLICNDMSLIFMVTIFARNLWFRLNSWASPDPRGIGLWSAGPHLHEPSMVPTWAVMWTSGKLETCLATNLL